MLDIQLLRTDAAAVAAKLAKRGFVFDSDAFDALEAQRKTLQMRTEELQSRRNSVSKQIGALKGQGKLAEAEAAMAEVAQIKTDLEQADTDYQAVQAQIDVLLLGIPNLPHESVPAGTDETEN